MFKRSKGKKEQNNSPDDSSVSSMARDMVAQSTYPVKLLVDSFVQVEVPSKTVGINTGLLEAKEASVSTDDPETIDISCLTDANPKFDAFTQAVAPCMDAAVDPGDWNFSPMRCVDSQTDTPEFTDPLFWVSGSFEQIVRLVNDVMTVLERHELDTSDSMEAKDLMQLRADNILLRLEVNALKRKVQTLDIPSPSVHVPWDPRRRQEECISGLTGGQRMTYIVTAEEGATVTSSLAPSSMPLGRLRKGDRVLLSGQPEEISGLVRAPVLPRGWVTLRNTTNMLLLKSA
jgi:hypothetical protein